MVGIRINDPVNDRFTVELKVYWDDVAAPTFESDIINYIKSRAASLPSVGVVQAIKTVETSAIV